MTDYITLERLAYIKGQHDLAALYDKAAMMNRLDVDTLIEVAEKGLDEIKEAEYKRGHAQGKLDASNNELLDEIAGLKTALKTAHRAHSELFNAYSNFLTWLGTDEAKLAATRKEQTHSEKIRILAWTPSREPT